uniref:HAT C-terminal dimerisation domain-containing protein n=1 Tax=Cacopsylla melanoneura TaxID=428564 RepID=A0A8D8LHW0_9HEMI
MHLHILAVFGDYAYIASFGIIIRKMINFDLKQKKFFFSTIEKVNLNGSGTSLPTTIDVGKSSKFKYCPMTSVDVERSFSSYKYILEDRRHRFTMENLGKIMVLHFNQNQAK